MVLKSYICHVKSNPGHPHFPYLLLEPKALPHPPTAQTVSVQRHSLGASTSISRDGCGHRVVSCHSGPQISGLPVISVQFRSVQFSWDFPHTLAQGTLWPKLPTVSLGLNEIKFIKTVSLGLLRKEEPVLKTSISEVGTCPSAAEICTLTPDSWRR